MFKKRITYENTLQLASGLLSLQGPRCYLDGSDPGVAGQP
jgi:hypothetical protein